MSMNAIEVIALQTFFKHEEKHLTIFNIEHSKSKQDQGYSLKKERACKATFCSGWYQHEFTINLNMGSLLLRQQFGVNYEASKRQQRLFSYAVFICATAIPNIWHRISFHNSAAFLK